MAFARIKSSAVLGVEAYLMDVEVDLDRGMPSFQLVGLPDPSVKESRDRVKSALKNCGFQFPTKRITINLAPADIPKEGPALDLPIAVGLLATTGVVESEKAGQYMMVGELALDGSVRSVHGVLPMALEAKRRSLPGIIVPKANAGEAAVVDGPPVYPINHIKELLDFFNGDQPFDAYRINPTSLLEEYSRSELDFKDVKGQDNAKRAMEIAAAGSHNILMIGPPGSGKTMLAQRLPTILPPMSLQESLETTKVHSIAGKLASGQSLVGVRPVRAPHHTISDAGLVGGGRIPTPGEVSLAHNGVLFLDELPEFSRNVLEVMRQPLECGMVTIARVSSTLTFPSRFMLVAAANPCPCGYAGDTRRSCTCSSKQIQAYQGKISGPLFDRIDLHLEVPAVKIDELDSPPAGESSDQIRQRVIRARTRQAQRYQDVGVYCNAHLPSHLVSEYAPLNKESKTVLRQAVESLGLSARAWDRIIKISRTIADLDDSTDIQTAHVLEAIQYRALDRASLYGNFNR